MEESTKSVSFLKPLKKYLKYARILGAFPLIIEDEIVPTLSFDKNAYFPLAIITLILFGINVAQQLVYLLNGFDGFDAVAEMQSKGLTITDIVCLFGLWIPQTLCVYAFFASYRSSGGAAFSKLFRALQDLPPSIIRLEQDDLDDLMKRILRKSYLIALMYVPAIITSGFVETECLKDLLPPGPWYFLNLVSSGILVTLSFLSPMRFASFLLTEFILGVLNLLMNSYVDQLEGNNNTQELDLDLGFYLTEMVTAADAALGKIIFIEFSVCFTAEIFGAFFGGCIFSAFAVDGVFNMIPFLFGAVFSLVGINSFIIIYGVSGKGQHLSSLVQRAKRQLEAALYKEEMELGRREKARCLLSRWTQPAAMRPMDAFDLGRATTLSMYGLLLTYIIVLLQFKFG